MCYVPGILFYVQCDVLRLLLLSILNVSPLTLLVARQEMASGIYKIKISFQQSPVPKTCDKRGKIGQLDKKSIERHTFISTIEPRVEREQRACTAVNRACSSNSPDEYAMRTLCERLLYTYLTQATTYLNLTYQCAW